MAIVPGSKVHSDGQPSPGLQRRLERALQVFRMGGVKAIVVSGGRGVEGCQEADVMRGVLLKGAIPADKITQTAPVTTPALQLSTPPKS